MNLAVFDIDGTLTDSFGFDAYFFEALSARLSVEDPHRSLASWTNVTDEGIVHEFFEMHGRRATIEDFTWTKARYERSLRAHLREVPQIPGASEILARLCGDPEWRVMIATGNWGFAGELKLAAGGVGHDGIPVIGCDGRPRRADVLSEALRVARAGSRAFDHVVYIGDAPYDVQATRELGWNFVGVNRDPERLLDLGATGVLPDYSSMDTAIDALRNALPPRST